MGVSMTAFHPDGKEGAWDETFSVEEAKKARAFHRQLAGYAPTPLGELKGLAGGVELAGV